MQNIKVINQHDFVQSEGLSYLNQYELRVSVRSCEFTSLAGNLLVKLSEYIQNGKRQIKPGEKIGWATSILRFDECSSSILESYEVTLDGENFKRGADDTLLRWREQSEKCIEFRSHYDPPALEDFVVVSPDVLDGNLPEGVRYPYLSPNTGWWLFGGCYSGDLKTMQRVHLGHVLRAVPSLAEYLALEPGFCFDLKGPPRVWFEDEPAQREPV